MPCGSLNRPARLLFFAVFLLALFPSISFSSGNYMEDLAARAASMKLHEKRAWHVLLHYKPVTFGGYKSLVDDPRFFNAPDGKRDPESELRETIKAFFRTDAEGDSHPQCRFIARYDWLKRELGIDPALLPKAECKGFRELHDSINPRSAVLVFPVAHMNSPASMFGHTLLRIDSDKESRMFSFAVNYSAITDETNGLFFAVKGIFGFYKGYFGVLPYYEKIKEYSNLENRDMWEYPLGLTPEEVERMVLHLWELKDTYTYYYFFDENCSYSLLLVLEAARPDMDISDKLPPWVIPMDTVRAIMGEKLNSGGALYRPSKASRIKSMKSGFFPVFKSEATDIAYGARSPEEILADAALERIDKARLLELASEYVQYRYSKRMITKEEYTGLYMRVLKARSTLGKIDAKDAPAPVPPEGGHGPARLSLGAGEREGASFLSLSLRPANHDLMDPDAGYLNGAAINFMDGELRYNLTERKLSLERLTFVGITSISPRDDFFKPISWKVDAELSREEFSKREHRTVFRLFGGPGLSYSVLDDGLAYAFMEPEAKFGSGLEDGYALGIGARAGIIKPINARWKAQLEAAATAFGPGDSHTVLSGAFNNTISINRDNAVKVNLQRVKFDDFYYTEVMAGWSRYF